MGYTLEKAHERITGKGKEAASSSTNGIIRPTNVRMYCRRMRLQVPKRGDHHLK